MKWGQVNWDTEQLTIIGTKGGYSRVLPFTKNLKHHLMCMEENGKGKYLFNSIINTGTHSKTMKTILNTIRRELKMEWFHYHLLRHYFISGAVMRGIDFLTIARFVGHKDGGVLIGKTYGHLTDAHTRRMATLLD